LVQGAVIRVAPKTAKTLQEAASVTEPSRTKIAS